jgi:hypothetical protein
MGFIQAPEFRDGVRGKGESLNGWGKEMKGVKR